MKPSFSHILKGTLGLLILVFLFNRFPLKETFLTMKGARIDFFLLALIVSSVGIMLSAVRWKVLLNQPGISYDLKGLSKISLIGFFFQIYVPGGVFGDIAKFMILKKHRSTSASHISASIIVERLIGLLSLLWMAAIATFFCYPVLKNSGLFTPALVIAGCILICVPLLFSKRLKSLLKYSVVHPLPFMKKFTPTLSKLNASLSLYRQRPFLILTSFIASVGVHLCGIGRFIFIGTAMGLDISLIQFFIFVPIIELAAAIPITQGGLGLREATAILLFSSINIPATQIMSLSLLSFIILLILGMGGGILFLWNRNIQPIAVTS